MTFRRREQIQGGRCTRDVSDSGLDEKDSMVNQQGGRWKPSKLHVEAQWGLDFNVGPSTNVVKMSDTDTKIL